MIPLRLQTMAQLRLREIYFHGNADYSVRKTDKSLIKFKRFSIIYCRDGASIILRKQNLKSVIQYFHLIFIGTIPDEFHKNAVRPSQVRRHAPYGPAQAPCEYHQ